MMLDRHAYGEIIRRPTQAGPHKPAHTSIPMICADGCALL